MDEVDKIILQQLRNLGCDIDSDVWSLRSLDSDVVGNCLLRCLQALGCEQFTGKQFSSHLNVIEKYRLASEIASECSRLGYKGEIGYQSVLYGSEKELRRLFAFLIEQLAKSDDQQFETESVISSKTSSSLEQHLKNVQQILRKKKEAQHRTTTADLDDIYGNSFFQAGDFPSLFSSSLLLRRQPENASPEKQQQSDEINHYLSNVCVPHLDSLPSILQWNASRLDSRFHNAKQRQLRELRKLEQSSGLSVEVRQSLLSSPKKLKQASSQSTDNKSDDCHSEKQQPQDEQEEESFHRERIQQSEQQCVQLEQQLQQIEQQLQEKKTELQHYEQTLPRTGQTLVKETTRLQAMASDRQTNDLREEINQMRTEIKRKRAKFRQFLEAYQEQVNEWQQNNELKLKERQALADELVRARQQISIGSQQLEAYEARLNKLRTKLPDAGKPKRSYYVKRMNEVLDKVSRQVSETNKVLSEIRDKQKEIRTLSGKVQRSFTLTEESLFRDAKTNSLARQSYRLLVELNEQYDKIYDAIESIGVTRRENLQLEERIINEKSNNMQEKIERITDDLRLLKQENDRLTVA